MKIRNAGFNSGYALLQPRRLMIAPAAVGCKPMFYRRQNIFRDFRNQFLTPEWIVDVRVDHANVVKIKWNVALVRGHRNNWLQRMGKPELIEHIGPRRLRMPSAAAGCKPCWASTPRPA